MPRHRLPPDTRPSWRDPAMPVMRDYKFANGQHKTVVDPEYERRYHEMLIEKCLEPDWKNDPTYNLRRGK